MNPGQAISPSASIVRTAGSSRRPSPRATMRPSRTPMSPRRPGTPVPSTMVAPRISSSSMGPSCRVAPALRATVTWAVVRAPAGDTVTRGERVVGDGSGEGGGDLGDHRAGEPLQALVGPLDGLAGEAGPPVDVLH